MLIDENRSLREQLENEMNKTKKSVIEDDNQTENLVNVLEELIESFKNIEVKYESQIG
jgi:archaellum component FlaC